MLSPGDHKRWTVWLLSLLCGVLLWLAWPPLTFNFIAFTGLVPLLALQDRLEYHYPRPAFLTVTLAFIAFLTWNVLATWWVYLATPVAILAFTLNALLMTLPIFFYQRVKRYAGRIWGYLALLCFWLTFEYMHLNWDAPWPWLNIGNVFAASRGWIQWYEYTGTLGGTLWVWIVNILIYEALAARWKAWFPRKDEKRASFALTATLALALIVIPVGISQVIKPQKLPALSENNIVAVQPNIDPYNDKFDPATYSSQLDTLISLSERDIDKQTVLVVWPETALAEDINEGALEAYPSIRKVKAFLARHPGLKLITGANSYTVYKDEDNPPSPTARPLAYGNGYYDLFNTALLLDSSPGFISYHKAKLVPGVEKMPYPQYLGILAGLAIDNGGAYGSLGSSKNPVVFPINKNLRVAPVICYESVFGEYVARYVRKGANVIAIITNDGWWSNTPGYKQHLLYGALRAIETRKFIVRAANTGVSAFILPNGEIQMPTGFWVPAVIKSQYMITPGTTFYVQHGDFIARIALYPAAVFFLLALFGGFLPRNRREP